MQGRVYRAHVRAVVRMLALGVLLLVISPDVQSQPSGRPAQAADVIHGDVLNIEGETYTIKDRSGHEVQLRVDQHTLQEDRIKVGDKVEVQVSSDGHAQSIRVAFPN